MSLEKVVYGDWASHRAARIVLRYVMDGYPLGAMIAEALREVKRETVEEIREEYAGGPGSA